MNRWIRWSLIMAGCCMILLTQCKNPLEPSIEDSSDFKVSASSGTKPTYSWSAGPALVVGVARYPSLFDAWSVVKTGSLYIVSPVKHGTIPPGASESFLSGGETTLQKGVQYLVTVSLVDGRTGFKVFKP